jgi:hypothetical protein
MRWIENSAAAKELKALKTYLLITNLNLIQTRLQYNEFYYTYLFHCLNKVLIHTF